MFITTEASLFMLILGLLTGRAYCNLADELRDCLSSLPRTQFVKSYNDVCLKLITRKLSWNKANSNCHRDGGRLVQIQNQDKQDFLYNTLKSMHWEDRGVWIGATDHGSEGTWKWTDGTELSYGYWQPGEGPAHGFLFSKAGYEDCAMMRLDDSGKWHDYDCGTILYRHTSICEYKKVYRPKITTLETTTLPATTTPTTVSTTTSTTTTSTTTTSTTTASTTISTTTKLSCSSFHPVASLVTFYRNSCLRFVKGDKSWNAANAECMEQGGGLLQIHSLQDQEYVFEKLNTLHWSDSGVWIGATDGDSEGRWKWSNGSPLTYSHWSSGEGPQHNATNENCAIVNADDGMWYDYNCEEVIYNQAYICQY